MNNSGYFLFTYLIQKFDIKTPGRRDAEEEAKLYERADYEVRKNDMNDTQLSAWIAAGLGGKYNIRDIDCCATRLRCTLEIFIW
jgi:PTS system D-glucosamine-specific IIC component